MTNPKSNPIRRVIIASNHPLFAEGLQSLLKDKENLQVEIVGLVTNLEEALTILERERPDLIILDYDDENLNREEFLARFVESESNLRVVLLSLQSSTDALVYDRRTLSAARIDEWAAEWNVAGSPIEPPKKPSHPTPPTSTPQKSTFRRRNMKHLIIAAILVVFVTALLILGFQEVQLLPVQASAQAKPIDQLFDLEFKVIAFLFSLIVVFMIYSIVVFRRKAGDTTDARHIEGNTNLEIAWTVAPLVTVLVFAYLGSQALGDTLRADPKPLEINVIGQQWSWRFEYPDFELTSDTLYLPVNKQAVLHLWSEDVIHSFWVPEFRVKQDALPGGEINARDLRITPSMTGEFTLRCAELCGRLHATMLAKVIVLSQTEFDTWLAEQAGELGDPVKRGEKWAVESGCLACHSVDGTSGVGPSWLGIFGNTESLADGSQITIDEDYLIQSILDPNAQITAGFQPNIMPQNFSDRLTLEQIQDIVEYIKSLK